MLKVGLIGCGFMGAMHANCYKNIEGVEIAAIADIRRDKAEALAEGTRAKIYGDGRELIEAGGLDIIDICLPTYLHAEYAMLAMEKVPYLFVEKPVALTAEEGRKMIEKSITTGCQVQIGQVIRFWDEYVELKKIIDSAELGAIVNANFRRISPRPDWGWQDWLLKYELSGGAAQDLHIHDIDYVLSLFGEPDKYYSVKNERGEKFSYVNTLMQYNGFVVTVEGTWGLPTTHPFEATFRAVFEKGVVENAGGKFMFYDDNGSREIKIEKLELASSAYAGGNISDLGGYYNELLYFCEQARKSAPIERAKLTDAVASLDFLLRELAFA